MQTPRNNPHCPFTQASPDGWLLIVLEAELQGHLPFPLCHPQPAGMSRTFPGFSGQPHPDFIQMTQKVGRILIHPIRARTLKFVPSIAP